MDSHQANAEAVELFLEAHPGATIVEGWDDRFASIRIDGEEVWHGRNCAVADGCREVAFRLAEEAERGEMGWSS